MEERPFRPALSRKNYDSGFSPGWQQMIRLATVADIPAIVVLERAARSAAHWSESQYLAISNADEDNPSPRLMLVAEEAGVLEGFLVTRTLTPEWELENIVVAESARRRGFGRQLVNALVAAARERRADSIFLEVRESNHAARALYLGCGFTQTGHRPAYYNCPTEDAVLYSLALS